MSCHPCSRGSCTGSSASRADTPGSPETLSLVHRRGVTRKAPAQPASEQVLIEAGGRLPIRWGPHHTCCSPGARAGVVFPSLGPCKPPAQGAHPTSALLEMGTAAQLPDRQGCPCGAGRKEHSPGGKTGHLVKCSDHHTTHPNQARPPRQERLQAFIHVPCWAAHTGARTLHCFVLQCGKHRPQPPTPAAEGCGGGDWKGELQEL